MSPFRFRYDSAIPPLFLRFRTEVERRKTEDERRTNGEVTKSEGIFAEDAAKHNSNILQI